METIDDIVREMRKDIPRVVDAKVILRNYADRIEAAVEYTLAVEKAKAAGEGYATGVQSVTDCNQLETVDLESRCIYGEVKEPTCEKSSQVGNAAKMREALEYLRDASREFCHLILNSKHNEIYDKYKYKEVAKIRDAIVTANATLSTPPRNCDRFINNEEARDAYCDYMSDSNVMFLDYEEWLFAEAKGETK